jgi:hypothetical protein
MQEIADNLRIFDPISVDGLVDFGLDQDAVFAGRGRTYHKIRSNSLEEIAKMPPILIPMAIVIERQVAAFTNEIKEVWYS